MEGPSALAMEDDGSLLIISRISDGSLEELEGDLLTAINLKSILLAEEGDSQDDPTVPEQPEVISWKPTGDDGNGNGTDADVEGQEDDADDGDTTDYNSLPSLDMAGLDELLEMELKNLQSIKMSNENLKKLVSSSVSSTPSVTTTTTSTGSQTVPDSTSGQPPPNFLRNSWGKLSNFRRRRPPPPQRSPTFNAFIQDYYRSLHSVSRYLILATVSGFLVGFLLLSWHGSQVHRNDMELFKLQESQYLSQQAIFQMSQDKHESFRESLIHQRYEETRECQSTLKSYLQGRHNLVEKISQLQKESQMTQSRLEDQVEAQRQEISRLQQRIQELQTEMAQSLSSSYTQILFGFLNIMKNRGFQFAVGGCVAVASLFILMISAFSKSVN